MSFPRRVGVHLFAVSLLVLNLSSPACQSPQRVVPRSYDLEFQLDPALRDASVQVDVTGIDALELPRWETYPVTDYWKPEDPMRRDADKIALFFGSGREPVQVIPANDRRWDSWMKRGAVHLVILAKLSAGTGGDRIGNADPRRLILPLDSKEWGKDVTKINIVIQESGLRLATPKPSLR